MVGSDRGDVARLTVEVPGSPERSELMVGSGLRNALPDLLPLYAPAHRYAVISDRVVARLHGEAVTGSLRDAGLAAQLFTFPEGEGNKNARTWVGLMEALAEAGFGRDACVVAVGGGVTGDLAGFVASTFVRGVPLVQVPTSLLAMIDASIGGKTGIDLEAGKNLAGTFHQPRVVVADPEVLETLPDSGLREGLAEAVKHGAVADASYLDRIGDDRASILARDPDALRRLIVTSVRVKARFVAEDVREAGARAGLNFGHTIGHALERVSGYALPHGVAVAVGMVAEARIGEAAGVTSPGTSRALAKLLEALGLPSSIPPELALDAVLEATRSDKKAREGAVRYTLLEGRGRLARGPDGAWTHAVSDDAVSAALADGDVPGSANAADV